MAALMAHQPFHALRFAGESFDCGDVMGLLRANLAYALADPGRGLEARALIEEELNRARPPRR
jgi:UTP--glucose-1-phosphate uridylyltransferase